MAQTLSAPNARHAQRTFGPSPSRCATRRCATRARNSRACRQIGRATLRHRRPSHPPVSAFDRYPCADIHTDQTPVERGAQRFSGCFSSICPDSRVARIQDGLDPAGVPLVTNSRRCRSTRSVLKSKRTGQSAAAPDRVCMRLALGTNTIASAMTPPHAPSEVPAIQ